MRRRDNRASKLTVVVAMATNAVIAVAKLTVGALSGSSSMLAEGAHSVADTLNEVLLFTSLRRSERPPDSRHPFGHGAERFFWSLLAAVGIFVSGAVFSGYQGISALLDTAGSGSAPYLWSYLVLLIAFLADGTSWVRSVVQLRQEAHRAGRGFVDHVRRSRDPTVRAVFAEDSAALIGVVLAAAGVGLHHATGEPAWDALGALAIAVLLTFVALHLGRYNMALLIGQSAEPELRRELWAELTSVPEVDAVVELLTMHIGTDEILVAVRLDLADDLDSDQVEDASSRIDDQIRSRHPQVTQVFLDATKASPQQRARAHRDLD